MTLNSGSFGRASFERQWKDLECSREDLATSLVFSHERVFFSVVDDPPSKDVKRGRCDWAFCNGGGLCVCGEPRAEVMATWKKKKKIFQR